MHKWQLQSQDWLVVLVLLFGWAVLQRVVWV
jgi:hypothetical protein